VGGAAAGSWPWLGGLLMIVAGACLVIGFATPVAGILAAATCVLAAVLVGTSAAAPYVCIMAAVVVLLGPGAWSVDARRYGRRQVMIVVTPSPPTSKQVPGPDPAEVSEDPSKP
jgi:uncharacterized membrane protein YphA (DoxX/SURF4 family)